MKLFHIIIFVSFLLLVLWRFMANLLFAEYFEEKIINIPILKVLEKRVFNILLFALYTYYAYLYAELSIFWLFIWIFFLLLFIFQLFVIYLFKGRPSENINVTEANLKRLVRHRRIFSAFDFFILAIWIYSWRFLI